MSNFASIIKRCEEAEGAGTKKIIQEALRECDETAIKLIHAAMNPYRVYGVRKYDAPTTSNSEENRYEVLFVLLDNLVERKLTGNAAQDAVTGTLAGFGPEEQPYIARIFDKDLRAGFSADTFNKIFPKNPIPTFDVMLADVYETDEEVKANVKFPCIAEAKYDGERTIAVVTQKGVTYYSRSGKEAKHVDGLFDNDLQDMRATVGKDIVVDGERYASNFTETMNAKKSGNKEAKDNLRFYAFFLMTLEDWKNNTPRHTMQESRQWLADVIKASNCQKVQLSKGILAETPEAAEKFYREMVAEGFEGLILKQLTATYEWDRSSNWIKWKPFFDADARIVGFYPGREKSRLENTLGGIEVAGYLEDGTYFETNVGSGFPDDLRDEIWNNKEKYLGVTAVIKYQEVSRAKNKDVASLRFPTLERFRYDKIVEIKE